MTISEFIQIVELEQKSQAEKVKLLVYFDYKENMNVEFTMVQISDLLCNSGNKKPNTTILKKSLLNGKNRCFKLKKGSSNKLEFIPISLELLEKDFGKLWNDNTTVESNSELIDETKFCGKRDHLSSLIRQINHTYSSNCYDACAVLMRRLFEVLLVLSYQYNNIDNKIKDNSNNAYIMLEGIVKNAKNNTDLKLSRNKLKYDTFREVGNFSAHSITYTAGKKDIDDIKLDYRVMLEELYNKSGLIK